jgi:hypothetical protein
MLRSLWLGGGTLRETRSERDPGACWYQGSEYHTGPSAAPGPHTALTRLIVWRAHRDEIFPQHPFGARIRYNQERRSLVGRRPEWG